MRRSQVMATLLTSVVLVLVGLAPVLGANPAPLERHIRDLRGQVRKLSPTSFERKISGKRVERFQITREGYNYVLTDVNKNKLVAWSRTSDHQYGYEAWYAFPNSKERLLEDDRSISYTSFHKNGQKWEQYSFNKLKKLKEYYVYDEQGKLKP